MTQILFLHGAADRLQAAVQWLHQAWSQRRQVLVFAPEAAVAAQVDRLMWTQPKLAFLPHCRNDSPLATETPIVITDDLTAPPQQHCLLNLSNDLAPTFARFEQLVEIVSTEDSDRLPARSRFTFYRDRGYAIENRDISGGL